MKKTFKKSEIQKQQATFSLIFAILACCLPAFGQPIKMSVYVLMLDIASLILGFYGQESEWKIFSTIGISLSSLSTILYLIILKNYFVPLRVF